MRGKDQMVEVEERKITSKKIFYDKILSSLNAMVFVFDMNSLNLVWVNEAFGEILGFKDPLKKVPDTLFHPDDQAYLEELSEFLKENPTGTFTGVLKMRNVNNQYVWLCSACNIFKKNKDFSVFQIAGVAISLNHEIPYDKNLKILTREKTKDTNHHEISKLTRRELQLIKHFASGKNSREIAEIIGLSFHTVNNHRKNILKKLQLKSIKALVNFAVENGLS
jgi:DNA-binding CsgD family transcriptional regulator